MEWIRKHERLCKKIGIAAGVYAGMKYLVPLLIPFFIAALLVCACWPFLRMVQRRFRIRPPYVMAAVLLLAAAALLAGAFALCRAAGSLAEWISGLFQDSGQMEILLEDCCAGVGDFFQIEEEKVQIFVTEQLNLFRDQAVQNVLPGAFSGSWQAVRCVGAWAAGLLVTGVAVLLTAADFEKIKEAGRAWPVYTQLAAVLRRILHSAGSYLRAQGIIMAIVMALCAAGIALSGAASHPLLLGLGVGLLDALPVFGTGTVFLPWILFLALARRNYYAALVLAATYGICVLTRELLEPKLIGERLGLLPVVILASVYAGVKLYGFGGIVTGPLSVLLTQELWRQVDAEEVRQAGESAEL